MVYLWGFVVLFNYKINIYQSIIYYKMVQQFKFYVDHALTFQCQLTPQNTTQLNLVRHSSTKHPPSTIVLHNTAQHNIAQCSTAA